MTERKKNRKKGKIVSFKTRKGKKIQFRTSRKKKQEITIKKIKRDNKSRKGTYYYIKERGKKPKEYKIKKGVTKELALDYYRRNIVSKHGGLSVKRIEKERKLDKKAKEYPLIDDMLLKGYAEYTIKEAQEITPLKIRTSYARLLMNKKEGKGGEPLVKDRDLLEILIRPENIERWKNRVLFEVQLKNENGEMLATIIPTGVKMLGEIKRDVIDELKVGEDYKLSSGGMEEEYKNQVSVLAKKIKSRGYNINRGTTTKGKLTSISIKMSYGKGG